MNPEPGTIIGIDFRTKRFLAVYESHTMRFARAEEVTPEAFRHAPRSVTEHHAIPKRLTPYGMVRQYAPRPMRAVRMEMPLPGPAYNRAMRRQMRRFK